MRKSFAFFLELAGVFIVLFVLSLSLFALFTDASEQIEQIKQDIQDGINHAKRKEFELAQELFKRVLAQHPQNAAAYNNLGNLDLLTGKSLTGYIKSFDNYCIVVEADRLYLIYKHAIADIHIDKTVKVSFMAG